jgi:hypothetical protein
LWALIGGGAAVLVALAGLGLLGWFLLGRAGGPPGSGSPAGGQAVSGLKPVMAPLPNAVARPATVEECQSRAQWSTLFVPMTARMSFWKR